MPHLDEGALHAYLDGALPHEGDAVADRSMSVTEQDVERHLSDCPDCSVALENARRLRDASASILSAAGPDNVVMPSFEELRARARVGKPDSERLPSRSENQQGGKVLRVRSLAWAATVILAAMVGWYARSAILIDRSGQSLSESDADAQLTIPIPRTERQTAERDSLAQTTEVLRRDTAEEGGPVTTAEEQPAEAEIALEIGGVQAPQVAPAAPAETSPSAERGKGVRDSVSLVGAVRLDLGERTESTGAQPRERIRTEAPQARRATVADAAPTPNLTQVAGGLGEGTEVAWAPLDEQSAASILRRPVPRIEGLPVIGYAVSEDVPTRTIRVVQSLGPGALIALYVTHSDSDHSSTEDKKTLELPDTVTNVTVVHNGLLIRLSADLTADSLNSLGTKIVPR
jgi:hypothetical protein